MCGMDFSTEGNLKKHQRVIHEQRKFVCEECGHAATRPEYLAAHRRAVHEGVCFYCDQCTYSTPTRSELTAHKKVKHESAADDDKEEKRLYYCGSCTFTSRSLATLTGHIEESHPDTADAAINTAAAVAPLRLKKVKCDHCEAMISRRLMTRHIMTVHSFAAAERPACAHCSMVFISKENLRKHSKMRRDGTIFACDQCDQKFCLELNLKRHKKTHTRPEDMMACDECDKIFINLRNLNRHKKIKHNRDIKSLSFKT